MDEDTRHLAQPATARRAIFSAHSRRKKLATFRRKNAVSEAALVRCGRNGVAFAVQFRLLSSIKRDREVGHSGPLQRETAPDLDHIIGDHTQSHPTLHAVEPAIQAATHSMSPFQGADAALTSGPPPLSTTKPALSIKSFAFRTLRLLIRHRQPSHSQGAGSVFILL